MIEFLVSWAEQLIVALIIIVVVEMIVAKMVFYAIFISISAVKPPLFSPKKGIITPSKGYCNSTPTLL